MEKNINLFNEKDYQFSIKIAVIGPCNVGKSSIIKRYTNKFFKEYDCGPTINIDIATKIIENDEKNTIKLEIWDTAGSEAVSSLMKSTFQRTFGYLIIFDLTDMKSFEEVEKWFNEIKKNGHPEAPIILVKLIIIIGL